MKCPRCHGAGKVPNRTRYLVEVRDKHQWYKRPSIFGHSSMTSLKKATALYEATTWSSENAGYNRGFNGDYDLKLARLSSISAKGKRRVLKEKKLIDYDNVTC